MRISDWSSDVCSSDLLLMYFGFTNCPDTCPTSLWTMTQALEAFGSWDAARAERVIPVFVSVDPGRDTPEVLREYARHFHPRLVALTGTPGQLAELGRAYGAYFDKVTHGEPGNYPVNHTSFIYLIGPAGKYVQHFEKNGRESCRERVCQQV